MPRKTMIVDLVEDQDNDRAKVTLVRAALRWTSEEGEWLGTTEGVWVEVAGTISLKDPLGQIVIATLQACSFDTTPVGATGRALFNNVGKTGRWLVSSVA